MLTPVSPEEAKSLLQSGAQMCDVREPGEFASGHVEGARNVPLSRLNGQTADGERPIIFCCLSGARTATNAARLAESAGRPSYVLRGGLQAWAGAGLPLTLG
jgi:rhodanese-related sulfurtransferase